MAGNPRTLYSTLLGRLVNVPDSPSLIGTPPPGYIWVARLITATFGDYLGFVQCGFSIGGGDPWLWLCNSGLTKVVGIHANTFTWEGRLVVPEGQGLYAMSSTSDTCDVLVSGYQLSGPVS